MDLEWTVTPVSGPRFRQRMSLQIVQCKSSILQYPGGNKMHKNTQMNKKNHGTSDIGLINCNDHIKRVSYLLCLDEKNMRKKKTRLCAGNMMLLKQHLNSMKRVHVAFVKCVEKKHTWSFRYARSMFVSRVERVCLDCPVVLISMMI